MIDKDNIIITPKPSEIARLAIKLSKTNKDKCISLLIAVRLYCEAQVLLLYQYPDCII